MLGQGTFRSSTIRTQYNDNGIACRSMKITSIIISNNIGTK